jgi:REP element-mobilizing transposase RayT
MRQPPHVHNTQRQILSELGRGLRVELGMTRGDATSLSTFNHQETACSRARCASVTVPRQILPGSRYLITRRCTQRQFLLRPSRLTNQTVRYCLAYAAEETGVLLHAVCFMSNHWHGVVTDVEGRLPEFLERFHRLVAKAQNASLGRWENFWSWDKTSAVLLISDADVLAKMAYVLANPTVAGLVRSPQEWPGVISHRFGEQRDIEMPDVFFDEEGEMPDEATLHFVRPAIFPALSDVDVGALLNDAVTKLVHRAREDMQMRGLPFLGRKTVLRQPFSGVPKTPAPHRNPSPRIAAKSTPRVSTPSGGCSNSSPHITPPGPVGATAIALSSFPPARTRSGSTPA